MKVIKIAQVPPPGVSADASVLDAVSTMKEAKMGACVVLENNQLVGIFSERDLMLRIVAAGARSRQDPRARGDDDQAGDPQLPSRLF